VTFPPPRALRPSTPTSSGHPASQRQALDALTKQLDAAQEAWEKSAERGKLPKEVLAILEVPAAKRSAAQKQKLAGFHRGLSAPWKALDQEVRDLEARLKRLTALHAVLEEIKPRPDARPHPR